MTEPALNKKETAELIVRKLQEAGYIGLFVGGAVRDMMLNREPFDFDIGTSATPKNIESLFRHTIPVGRSFGVVRVIENGFAFDLATFRRDGSYSDKRRPDKVVFTVDPKEDANRRDFTVNGLMFDPVKNKILDFVGGIEDLNHRTIRAIGDPNARFEEDRLRIFRAVRFATVLDFSIDENTADAIRRSSTKIVSVSAERIREELFKLLGADNASYGIKLLDDLGILKHVIPEVESMKETAQPKEFHPEGDVYFHSLLTLKNIESDDPVLRLAALIHDIGKPSTYSESDRIRFNGHAKKGAEIAARIAGRLRLSNSQTNRLVGLVKDHMRIGDTVHMREAKLKKFLAREDIFDLLELHKADCLASHGNLENYEYCIAKRAEFKNTPALEKPLITGHDLISIGLDPGPIFGKILAFVEDGRLEGTITGRNQAIEMVKKKFAKVFREKDMDIPDDDGNEKA